MNTQIYLFLVRDANLPFHKGKLGGGAKIAASIPLLLKNVIAGDSLDVPFLRMIKVDSVENKIAFTENEPGGYSDIIDARARSSYAGFRFGFQRKIKTADTPSDHRHKWLMPKGDKRAIGNTFMKSHLPDHGDFTFVKQPDQATPQLAYGCSTQQVFPLAIFFFRRKIGVGVNGIRLPYMCIGLRKTRLVGWELGADLSETVTMKYAEIAWTAVPPLADTNLPGAINVKDWDTEASRGMNGHWFGYVVQTITAGIVAAGGVATSALG